MESNPQENIILVGLKESYISDMIVFGRNITNYSPVRYPVIGYHVQTIYLSLYFDYALPYAIHIRKDSICY